MSNKEKKSPSPYQICSRCIIDSTVPGHAFDADGLCAYCRMQEHLEKQHPLTPGGSKNLDSIIRDVKKKSNGSTYDCVVGVSGGRDSTYCLWVLKKVFGLNPLAVHFNDGFGNPVAGENMHKATSKLGIELRTITSDWRESKDLRIAFLKASTPDIGNATDIGIANALYNTAVKENIKYIIIGQSFRTEGIAPLEWNYLDGRYLLDVHKQFGKVPLRKWQPTDGGFNLTTRHMFYYSIVKGIKTAPIFYDMPYVRTEADKIIQEELGWVNPGAHYFDDLYQSLMTYVLRTKFKIDRRRFNYSALIRSGQMDRMQAHELLKKVYSIEDPEVINLCIKRLGLTREEFDEFMKLPLKTFRDYRTSYKLIKLMRIPIKIASKLNFIPSTAYAKYFECG
jgi:N-acetyl sugar amidotransferase